MNEEREQKIATIKAQIEAGTYDISGERIANSILLTQQNHSELKQQNSFLETAIENLALRHSKAMDRIAADALIIHRQKIGLYALALIGFFGWFFAYGFWPR
jgi:hypothetical protein